MDCLLLILQYFDWLAAFHLELLQAILFIAVLVSDPVFLILLRMRDISDKSYREDQNKYCMFNNFFPKIVPLMQ